jgi:hypothetical protein
MCLNCGCHLAHEDHGKQANITYEDLKRAAEANDMGVAESLAMMLETAEVDRKDHQTEYETGGRPIVGAGARGS